MNSSFYYFFLTSTSKSLLPLFPLSPCILTHYLPFAPLLLHNLPFGHLSPIHSQHLHTYFHLPPCRYFLYTQTHTSTQGTHQHIDIPAHTHSITHTYTYRNLLPTHYHSSTIIYLSCTHTYIGACIQTYSNTLYISTHKHMHVDTNWYPLTYSLLLFGRSLPSLTYTGC